MTFFCICLLYIRTTYHWVPWTKLFTISAVTTYPTAIVCSGLFRATNNPTRTQRRRERPAEEKGDAFGFVSDTFEFQSGEICRHFLTSSRDRRRRRWCSSLPLSVLSIGAAAEAFRTPYPPLGPLIDVSRWQSCPLLKGHS